MNRLMLGSVNVESAIDDKEILLMGVIYNVHGFHWDQQDVRDLEAQKSDSASYCKYSFDLEISDDMTIRKWNKLSVLSIRLSRW